MAKKQESNFKKAMNELLGAEPQKTEEPKKIQPKKVEKPVEEELPKIQEYTPEVSFKVTEPVIEKPVVREEAVIPADMVITGNISTRSNMRIMGSIIGDVECEGNILLHGSVQGNIKTGNLTIQHGNLKGDAEVKENLIIEMESVQVGNVIATNIYSNAKIEGQLKVAGTVELKEDALVQGDIIAGDISIKSGAKIKGMVTISE